MLKPAHLVYLAMLTATSPALAQSVSHAFTFQGRLTDGASPAAGSYDLRFRLFDAASAGGQVGATLCADNVSVTDGVFTVQLDFGDQFSAGSQRFLEIDVRTDAGADCSVAAGFTTLGSRQSLTAGPFASFAINAGSAGNAGQLNGLPASFYTNAANLASGTLADARLSSNVATLVSNQTLGGVKIFTNAANSFTGSGAGLTALNASNISAGTIADARLSSFVARTNVANTFNMPQTFSNPVTIQNLLRFANSSFDVNANTSTRVLHVDTFASDPPNVVLGAPTNSVLGAGSWGATIAGGGQLDALDPTTANIVTDAGGTISGGAGNRAGDLAGTGLDAMFATVGGGERNRATGERSTIAGGTFNGAGGDFASVGGGQSNNAFGAHCVVGGGNTNDAQGIAGAVLGGESNAALNNYGAVVGGLNNAASTKGFVGGGENNSAGGAGFAAVGGGLNNSASGQFAAIPGGELNLAAGAHSFAAGRRAHANNAGSFVWADSTDADFASTGLNQFLIRAGGGVGIGTTAPAAALHVRQTAVAATPSSAASLVLERNSGNALVILGSDAGERSVIFGSPVNAAMGGIAYQNSEGFIFRTGGVIDRATLDASGNFGVGDQSPDARLDVESVGATVAQFNRVTNDGVIIEIQQGGITEGSIAVAGTTVSYNAFTGSHFAWTDDRIERSELVSFTGVNKRYHDRESSEPLYGVRRTAIANDPAVLGAYLALLEPSKSAGPENPHQIMAVGNGDMWVVETGSAIEAGDYLISSDVPGCAMKDDPARYAVGHVVARAAERIDWTAVTPGADGRKRVRMSVLFGNFVRASEDRTRVMEERLATLERILGQ
ncbi:hypothetical protein PHYC_03952 [Phycisphaerales bacterium]|nr:hypothetical protein PHYC_03952 [Phycisphaerales bacterium]